jgi:hypothetical protein
MTIAHRFIGIDISKMYLDIFDDRFGSIERIANTPAAIAAALARWQRADTRVIFEATGSYDRVLRRALEAAGIAFVRVNPARARDFARATSTLAKTDAIDARLLAAMGRALALVPREAGDPLRERLATCTAAATSSWPTAARRGTASRSPRTTTCAPALQRTSSGSARKSAACRWPSTGSSPARPNWPPCAIGCRPRPASARSRPLR